MFDQVMKLVNAGFTKDEIMKMMPVAPSEEPPKEEPPKEEPLKEEPPKESASLSAGLNDLLMEMDKTLKSIQNANIQSSRMPEESHEKPEEILAKLLYPNFNQKEKSK